MRVTSVDGIKGNWVAPASMNRILFLLEECIPSYERILDADENLISTQKLAVQTASVALTLGHNAVADSTKVSADWKASYTQEHQLRMDEQSVLRSPVLWFAVGVVAASAGIIGTAYALHVVPKAAPP